MTSHMKENIQYIELLKKGFAYTIMTTVSHYLVMNMIHNLVTGEIFFSVFYVHSYFCPSGILNFKAIFSLKGGFLKGISKCHCVERDCMYCECATSKNGT